MLRPILIGILIGAAIFFIPFGFPLLFILFFIFCLRFFFRPWRSNYWRYHYGFDQPGSVPIDGHHAYESYDRNAPTQTISVH